MSEHLDMITVDPTKGAVYQDDISTLGCPT